MRNIFYTTTLFAIISLVSCKPFQLSLGEGLKDNNDAMEVKGRSSHINQKLSFGNYKTTKIKRSWMKGSGGYIGSGFGNPMQEGYVNLIGANYVNKQQTLHYGLTNGTDTSMIFCVSKFNSEDLLIGKNQNSIFNIGMDIFGGGYKSESGYYVQVFPTVKSSPWQLTLDNEAAQAHPNTYKGLFAKNDKEYYTIHPANKVEKNGKTGATLFGSMGYEIRNAQGQAVAAVSTMDKGMVYLQKTNEQERFLLANLCSAILLQEVATG